MSGTDQFLIPCRTFLPDRYKERCGTVAISFPYNPCILEKRNFSAKVNGGAQYFESAALVKLISIDTITAYW